MTHQREAELWESSDYGVPFAHTETTEINKTFAEICRRLFGICAELSCEDTLSVLLSSGIWAKIEELTCFLNRIQAEAVLNSSEQNFGAELIRLTRSRDFSTSHMKGKQLVRITECKKEGL